MLGMWKYSKSSWKEQKIFPELCQTGTEGPLQVICRDRNEDHRSVVLQEHFILLLLLSKCHPSTFQQPVVAVGCWQRWYQPRGGTGVEVRCQR